MAANSKRAAEILSQIIYAIIATADENGQPWNSPVYTAFDDDLNFFWTSAKESRHSQNVRANGRVFLVIYDSTAPQGTGEAVYIQAEAAEITDPQQIDAARTITQGRKGLSIREDEYKHLSGDSLRRVYEATPQKIWMNDAQVDAAGEFIRDFRVEIPIDKLRQEIA